MSMTVVERARYELMASRLAAVADAARRACDASYSASDHRVGCPCAVCTTRRVLYDLVRDALDVLTVVTCDPREEEPTAATSDCVEN